MVILGAGRARNISVGQCWREAANSLAADWRPRDPQAAIASSQSSNDVLWTPGGGYECAFYERTSKRRRGFASETHVKRGPRVVHGDKELLEKLGRNDPCPCGSGRRFQERLPAQGSVLTADTSFRA